MESDRTFAIRHSIEDAVAKHLGIIVGGDLNSCLDGSPRGLLLYELISGFNLQVCNDPFTLHHDHAWTYQHTLHGRHQIDFLFVSQHFTIDDGRAVNELDLGSDHRAVRACVQLPTQIQRRRICSKRVKRGWRPSDNFVTDVEEKLDSTSVHSLFELGQILSASAHSTTPETNEDPQLKPWQNADVKDLIRQRHNCSDPLTSRNLSNAIFKATRKHTRDYCTSQTERILRPFKGLGRLDDL